MQRDYFKPNINDDLKFSMQSDQMINCFGEAGIKQTPTPTINHRRESTSLLLQKSNQTNPILTVCSSGCEGTWLNRFPGVTSH